MPRPTAAQFAYGSATVVFATLAMLLLSRTSSGVGVAVIVLAALVLGLLVATTVPIPRPGRRTTGRTAVGGTATSVPATVPAAVRVSAPPAGAERVSEHSLRS